MSTTKATTAKATGPSSGSFESKTKFLFQLSQDVLELQRATAAAGKAQQELAAAVADSVRPAIAQAQESADAAQTQLRALRADHEALAARVAALEARLDSKDAALAATVRAETEALERRLAQDAKERDAGTWAVFDRKSAAAAEAGAQQLAAVRAELGAAVDAKCGEVLAATRHVREGAKSLRTIEQQLRRGEQFVQAAERVSARIDSAQRTADEALAAAQQAAQRVAAAVAAAEQHGPVPGAAAAGAAAVGADAASGQLAAMEGRVSQQLTKIECAGQLDHARVMDAVQKVEQERESLVQAIQQELFASPSFPALFISLSPSSPSSPPPLSVRGLLAAGGR